MKLYAWEDSFKERVQNIREDELRELKIAAFLNAGSALSWFMAPYLVSKNNDANYSESEIMNLSKGCISRWVQNIGRMV